MSWPAIVIFAVVLFVGLPSAWRNPTAAALVLSWTLSQAIWLFTDNNLPLKVYIMADIAVLAVISMKSARSSWDWIVVMIFPLMWVFYVINVGAREQWYILWFLVLAQFLAVGGEAVHSWIDGRKAKASAPDHSPSGYEFAAVMRGFGGYG